MIITLKITSNDYFDLWALYKFEKICDEDG
jgi:hypothetical protein